MKYHDRSKDRLPLKISLAKAVKGAKPGVEMALNSLQNHHILRKDGDQNAAPSERSELDCLEISSSPAHPQHLLRLGWTPQAGPYSLENSEGESPIGQAEGQQQQHRSICSQSIQPCFSSVYWEGELWRLKLWVRPLPCKWHSCWNSFVFRKEGRGEKSFFGIQFTELCFFFFIFPNVKSALWMGQLKLFIMSWFP